MIYVYSLRGKSEPRGPCEIVTWLHVGHRNYPVSSQLMCECTFIVECFLGNFLST